MRMFASLQEDFMGSLQKSNLEWLDESCVKFSVVDIHIYLALVLKKSMYLIRFDVLAKFIFYKELCLLSCQVEVKTIPHEASTDWLYACIRNTGVGSRWLLLLVIGSIGKSII